MLRLIDFRHRLLVRIWIGFILSILLISPALANRKYSSIVIQPKTNEVLHLRHADALRYPASLTKMMTLYLTFEALEEGKLTLDQRLVVSQHAENAKPSELGLKRDERITVRDAINSMITKSANDSAIVLAEAIAGTESQFARKMTRKARALGMNRTRFRNATGWHDRRQYSTARDLARLAEHLMEDYPRYYNLFAQKSFSFRAQQYKNTNKLLGSYSGVDGIKTGYTRKSGYNLAASAQRDGERVIAIVMGGKSGRSRNRHMVALLDAAFKELKNRPDRAVQSYIRSEPPALASGLRGRIDGNADRQLSVTANDAIIGRGGSGLSSATPPAPAATAIAGLEVKESWFIQVGAFLDPAIAQKTLDQALRAQKKLLSSAKGQVSPVTLDGKKIFRARFSGLSQEKARNACKRLLDRGFTCYSLREAISS